MSQFFFAILLKKIIQDIIMAIYFYYGMRPKCGRLFGLVKQRAIEVSLITNRENRYIAFSQPEYGACIYTWEIN